MPAMRRCPRECPFCEATCSLLVEADSESGALGRIVGDPDSELSRGFVCPKSQGLRDLRNDPDRLRRPLIREGDSFRDASWDEALDLAADLLRKVAAHGPDSLGFYIGNPAGHNVGLMLGLFAFLGAAGSKQIYSACSVDIMPRFLTNIFLYGNRGVFPVPDIDRTQHMLVIGANPVASNGSTFTAPGFARRIEALQARGGKLVVIDPRRTETAAIADEYIAIRPGADALLLLAMVHTLFAEGLVNLRAAEVWVKDMAALRALTAAWTPERVADATGIDAERIRTLTRDLAQASAGIVHGRVSACAQRFGSLTSWLIECLNILTGNLDRAGGVIFPPAVVPSIFSQAPYVGKQAPYDRYRSRVAGAPEVGGEFPTFTLPDEIMTPGAGQIRGFICFAGNPVLSNANSDRLREALGSLEAFVSIDFYLNETSRHAHVILPPPDPLSRDEFTFAYAAQIIGSFAQYSPAVFSVPEDGMSDFDIVMNLTSRYLGLERKDFEKGFLTGFAEHFCVRLPRWPSDGDVASVLEGLDPALSTVERLYDLLVRAGPCGDGFGAYPGGMTLEMIREAPSGVMLGLQAEGRLAAVLETPDRKIPLAPAIFVADIDRLQTAFAAGEFTDGTLRLIGRRDVRSNNSWMHNLPALAKGKIRCTAMLHPDDAQARGVEDGDWIEVSSVAGRITLPASVDAAMMPGVVCIPHGWGHDEEGARLQLAAQRPGANFNTLTDYRDFDVPSGNSVLNGIPVEVRRLQAAASG
ncbi:MAG: molybdopterin-dependent oxidoreductase [Caulobacterales bacterium]